MVGSPIRFAAVAAFSLLVSACASAPDITPDFTTADQPAAPAVDGVQVLQPATPISCVPYARAHSGINLHGDALTWLDQAKGRYAVDSTPSKGAVIVLTGYAGAGRGHLAIVRAQDSAREIRVDHANWMNDGQVYLNDPVVDVSPDNDWSAVRVWNARDHSWGVRTYLVQGFIAPGTGEDQTRVAGQF